MTFGKVTGKCALLTGAAGGIGFALAKTLQKHGARIFLSDVDAERLAQSASELGVASAPCDVRDPNAIDAVVDRAWQELGGLDLLFANAGVIRTGSLLAASQQEIDWHFDVNVWGILHSVRSFHRRLLAEGRGGHILMTGSENSLSNPEMLRGMGTGVYNLSKHGVLAMADVLRGELGEAKIGVSVLCPGVVNTGLGKHSEPLAPAPHAKAKAPRQAPSQEAIDWLLARTRSAEKVADIAIAGLERDLFVIPTHPHTEDDVAERYGEIQRGLQALRDFDASA